MMMKTVAAIAALCITASLPTQAEVEPNAGSWKTWVITSGSELRLPAPITVELAWLQHDVLDNQTEAEPQKQMCYWLCAHEYRHVRRDCGGMGFEVPLQTPASRTGRHYDPGEYAV
jgi:hypothetical protein